MTDKIRCSKCGYSKHIGSLQIHHVDGVHQNNNQSNLIVLCANCHFEEHHLHKKKRTKQRDNRNKEDLIKEIVGQRRVIDAHSNESNTLQRSYPDIWLEIQKICYPKELK